MFDLVGCRNNVILPPVPPSGKRGRGKGGSAGHEPSPNPNRRRHLEPVPAPLEGDATALREYSYLYSVLRTVHVVVEFPEELTNDMMNPARAFVWCVCELMELGICDEY